MIPVQGSIWTTSGRFNPDCPFYLPHFALLFFSSTDKPYLSPLSNSWWLPLTYVSSIFSASISYNTNNKMNYKHPNRIQIMDDEITELVFENGRILTRGRSRNSSSCFSYRSDERVRKKPKLDCQNNNSAAFFGGPFGDDSCCYNDDKHISESQIVPQFNNTPFDHRQCDPINNGNQSLSSWTVDEYCKRKDKSASVIRQMVHPISQNSNTPPHEHSEALHLRLNLVKEKASASISVSSSRGASNDLSFSSFNTTSSEETEMMRSANEKDQQMPKPAPSRTASRRKPSPQVHSLFERKRRQKINKKMRELQALLPNSDKVDKVSMLDNAIEYIKALQVQIQIMSMGSRFWMSQMMIPNGMQQMAHHLSPAMGTRMGMGVGLGLPGRMPIMPPFMPFVGGGGGSSSMLLPVMANSINGPSLGSSSSISSRDNNTRSSVQFSSCSLKRDEMKMKKRMDES